MENAAACHGKAIHSSESSARKTDGSTSTGKGVGIGRYKCGVGSQPPLEDEPAVPYGKHKAYSQLVAVVGSDVVGQLLRARICRRHGGVDRGMLVSRRDLQPNRLSKRENEAYTGGRFKTVTAN